jgi:hypothetical protein
MSCANAEVRANSNVHRLPREPPRSHDCGNQQVARMAETITVMSWWICLSLMIFCFIWSHCSQSMQQPKKQKAEKL